MSTTRYFECQNCGRIHYGITQEQADKINGHLYGEFNERNLKRCANCGSSYPFIETNEEYANRYLHGGEVEPWLYPPEADEQNTTQANTS